MGKPIRRSGDRDAMTKITESVALKFVSRISAPIIAALIVYAATTLHNLELSVATLTASFDARYLDTDKRISRLEAWNDTSRKD